MDTEVAIFDKSYFEELWKDLFKGSSEEGIGQKVIEKNVLACANEMFSGLNDLTLTTLVYELFEIRTFKKGERIMEQSKQAPTNKDYRSFYTMQLSKMAVEIKKRKQQGGGTGTSVNTSQIQDVEGG